MRGRIFHAEATVQLQTLRQVLVQCQGNLLPRGSKWWVSVMGDALGKPVRAEPRDRQRMGAFHKEHGEATTRLRRGGLTKSDLRLKNNSWLHLERGGWISGLRVDAGRPVRTS